jgi:hypothetical protein
VTFGEFIENVTEKIKPHVFLSNNYFFVRTPYYRQLALKALNERLSRVPAAHQWPSVDEPESSDSTMSSPVAQGSAVTSTQNTENVASADNSDLLNEKSDSSTQ